MREYIIQKEMTCAKWNQAGACIEQDIENAKKVIRELHQADPTLLVMGQDVAVWVIRLMKASGYTHDPGLAFHLLRHQLPPRFMDMKVLVIPVELSFMFPELANDVWIVYEQDMIVLREVIRDV